LSGPAPVSAAGQSAQETHADAELGGVETEVQAQFWIVPES
jgi:hypothetical protein